jgi:hypothetical protein
VAAGAINSRKLQERVWMALRLRLIWQARLTGSFAGEPGGWSVLRRIEPSQLLLNPATIRVLTLAAHDPGAVKWFRTSTRYSLTARFLI